MVGKKTRGTKNSRQESNSKMMNPEETSFSSIFDSQESSEDRKKKLHFQLQFLQKEENFIQEQIQKLKKQRNKYLK